MSTELAALLQNIRELNAKHEAADKALHQAKHNFHDGVDNAIEEFATSLQDNIQETLLKESTDHLGLIFALARYSELLKIRSVDDPTMLPTANSHYCSSYPNSPSETLWNTFKTAQDELGFSFYPSYQLTYRERNGERLHTAIYVSVNDKAQAVQHQAVFDHVITALSQHLEKTEVLRVWLGDERIAEYRKMQDIPIWCIYPDASAVLRERGYDTTISASPSILNNVQSS